MNLSGKPHAQAKRIFHSLMHKCNLWILIENDGLQNWSDWESRRFSTFPIRTQVDRVAAMAMSAFVSFGEERFQTQREGCSELLSTTAIPIHKATSCASVVPFATLHSDPVSTCRFALETLPRRPLQSPASTRATQEASVRSKLFSFLAQHLWLAISRFLASCLVEMDLQVQDDKIAFLIFGLKF